MENMKDLIIEKVIEMRDQGIPVSETCKTLGIGASTYYRYLKNSGRKVDPKNRFRLKTLSKNRDEMEEEIQDTQEINKFYGGIKSTSIDKAENQFNQAIDSLCRNILEA